MRLFRFYLLTVTALIVFGCNDHDRKNSQYYLFVGTYTGGSSKGIYLYKFDSSNGSIDSLITTAETFNPSYLALSPDHSMLYAVNEMADSAEASVSSFAFSKEKESLTFMNKQPTHGGAPCYVSVDDNGKAVFAANYLGGSFSMFPVKEDGSLMKPQLTVEHSGGSVNKDRQNSPHVHCTFVSPDNRRLIVDDLGTDKVYGYVFNPDSLQFKKDPEFVFEGAKGAGPRHITFHPNGKFAYLVNELNGSVVAFRWQDDTLHAVQTVSTLPDNYDGKISGADIHVSPDGQFLYTSNREDLNDIVIFKIDQQDGTLTKIGSHGSGGVHPRNFMIDPTGNYLLAANRNTNNIVVFKRDKKSGELTPTGTEIEVSQPVCLKMIPVE